MKFVYLTYPEIEGIAIRWNDATPKTQELVAAALAAGFTEHEVFGSPVGVLEEGFGLTENELFKVGAIALMGTNGSTLIEMS
ncbi:MAG: hypothetical protein K8U57_24805 [Planctomycetes bacterium]|nr:hypothetical protein [Planctomycetota bacterium]